MLKNGLIWNIFFGPSKEMTLQYISYSTPDLKEIQKLFLIQKVDLFVKSDKESLCYRLLKQN